MSKNAHRWLLLPLLLLGLFWAKPVLLAQTPAETPPTVTTPEPTVVVVEPEDRASVRLQGLMASLTIFTLAIFVGFEIIAKVPTTLHTPLMSGSNAISGITLAGAVIIAGSGGVAGVSDDVAAFIGMIAVALAAINVVGGFLVTHRMLAKFQKK